jgi:hypothetical protein
VERTWNKPNFGARDIDTTSLEFFGKPRLIHSFIHSARRHKKMDDQDKIKSDHTTGKTTEDYNRGVHTVRYCAQEIAVRQALYKIDSRATIWCHFILKEVLHSFRRIPTSNNDGSLLLLSSSDATERGVYVLWERCDTMV